MLDERELRRALKSLVGHNNCWLRDGKAHEFIGREIARCFGETDAVSLHWLLRTEACALEFRLVVEDLSARRVRARVVDQVVVLHTPPPVWMPGKPCSVIDGRYCLCIRSDEAGKEIAEHFFGRIGTKELLEQEVWAPLEELYRLTATASIGPIAHCIEAPLMRAEVSDRQ